MPSNLFSDLITSSSSAEVIKAMRAARPRTVRQFFALANKHMRWELNDLAQRLDKQRVVFQVIEGDVPVDSPGGVDVTPDYLRMLDAITQLPEDEREVFELVRIQGLTHGEADVTSGKSRFLWFCFFLDEGCSCC